MDKPQTTRLSPTENSLLQEAQKQVQYAQMHYQTILSAISRGYGLNPEDRIKPDGTIIRGEKQDDES